MNAQSDIATASGPPRTGEWATCDPLVECQAALHKKAFRLTHALVGHPLFSIDALIGVAQDAAKRKRALHVDAGRVSVTDKWGNIPVPDMPVAEVMRRIETAGAWIVMKNVESNPKYRAVLDEWVGLVRSLAGPIGSTLLRKPEMIVFITSPNRITPYHFDREINFLVQVQGAKDIWICDPLDRTITTEVEIERYYAATITAGNYKPHAEERARKFVLVPGEAVHIPTHAAHWVKNHDNVSVSLSLNFEFPNWYEADVYRTNYYLRRLGLSPRPPAHAGVTNWVKASTGLVLRHTKHTVGTVYRSAKRFVRN